MRIEFELDLPDDLAADKALEDQLAREAKQHTVLTLYSGQRIPAAAAAALLGLTRAQFVELLHQHSIPYIVSDATGLEDEVKAIGEYLKSQPQSDNGCLLLTRRKRALCWP